MTTAADDRAAEQAFEASLAGRPVPAEAAGLAAFTGAVRGSATQPGRPSAALAELLSTGLLTDQSSPSTRTAPAAGSLPSRSARSRTRRRFTVIVPALIAKFLSAGAVAQAATGAGVVVVVVTGAGTAGVLPAGAQQTFSGLTGISRTADEPVVELTDAGGDQTDADGDLADDQLDGDQLGGGDPAVPPTLEVDEDGSEAPAEDFDPVAWAEGYDPEVYPTFGAWVSLGAHNKAQLAEALTDAGYRNFGAMVSAEARKKGMGEDELADELEDVDLDLGDVTEGGTGGTEQDSEDATGDAGAEDAGDDSAGPATSSGTSAGKGHSAGQGADKADKGADKGAGKGNGKGGDQGKGRGRG